MDQYLLDKLTDIERHKAVEQMRKERGNRPLHNALITQNNMESQRQNKDR